MLRQGVGDDDRFVFLHSRRKVGGYGICNFGEDVVIVAKHTELGRRLQPHLERLPIFPLYRVTLFPRSLLPLYVFEPRYREMTASCIEHGGIMAVASLRPGYQADYEGRPPVRRVAGVGKIVAHRLNPDGTYNILLRGLARVRILEELPPERSFREVRARLIKDRWPEGFDLAAARSTLSILVERLASLVTHGGDALRELLSAEGRPSPLIDALAAALVGDRKLRLRLLESPDLSRRTDLLTDELGRLIARLSQRDDKGAN